jgi:penicillin-binding protein 1A
MHAVGRVGAFVALVVARRQWREIRGDLAAAHGRYATWVRPRLSPVTVAALVAAEDPRFHRHGGIDAVRLGRALWRGGLRRALERGTTLEHRLVRIVAGRGDRRLTSLARSMLLAGLVRRVVPKADVPGVYLTVASFGAGMDGIQRACRRLGFELGGLTPLQTASVLARLRYPEPPILSPRRARRIAARAERVLALAGGPAPDDELPLRVDAEDDGAPRPPEELEEAGPEVLAMEGPPRPLALVAEHARRPGGDVAAAEVEVEPPARAEVGHPVGSPAAVPQVERAARPACDEPEGDRVAPAGAPAGGGDADLTRADRHPVHGDVLCAVTTDRTR